MRDDVVGPVLLTESSSRFLRVIRNGGVGSGFKQKFDEEERNVKVIDATIGQIAKLVEKPTLFLDKLDGFFDEKQFKSNADTVGVYMDNILQYTLEDFFTKEKKYKIIHKCGSEYTDNASPTMRSLEYDLNKTTNVYSDGGLFFQDENGEHVLTVCIYYDEHRFCTEYFFWYTTENCDIWQEWKEYAKEHNFYKNKKIDGFCKFLELDKDISWDDIIIDEKTRNNIRKNVENLFKYRDIFKENDISMKRGVILAGKPGVGKTLICKILAKETNVSVVYIAPEHINSVKDVARVCDMARDLSPTLFIIEDIDFLAEDRRDGGYSGITVELMNKMDGIENFGDVITVATTNLPEKIEEAIKNRPGRFDRVLNVDLPDAECRVRMLKRFTKSIYMGDDVDFEHIAEKCDKMSGAYVANLCGTAAACAVFDDSIRVENGKRKVVVKAKHFDEALDDIKDPDSTCWGMENKDTGFGFGEKPE